MNPASQHNIGGFVAVATSIAPQSASGNVNGSSVDRFARSMPLSCVLHQAVGAASGSPSAFSVQAKLQHAPDNATWSDYVPPPASTVAQTAALTTANTDNAVSIDLSSAARYVRAVALVTLTGGSSPAVAISADIVIGGETLLPST